jgi:cyanate lyase
LKEARIDPGSAEKIVPFLPYANEGYVTLAIYTRKYLKAKERRIMETQIFHHSKNIHNLQKNPLKETKINPSRIL